MVRFFLLFLFFCFPFFAICEEKRNNYDPHLPPTRGSWFEGWYTRIIDPKGNKSLAVVFGSSCVENALCNHDQNLPGYLAILFQHERTKKFETIELFPNKTFILEHGKPVDKNPDFSSPPSFHWECEYGHISQDRIDLTISEKKLHFEAKFSNPIYWNPKIPGEGPEGLAQSLPLQQHWFVYSLGSNANYLFQYQNKTFSGSGFAHQEKNWGSSFPSGWIWSEAISDDNQYHLAISGGDVPIVPPFSSTLWLVGFRSPKLSWNFRPQDFPTFYSVEKDGCLGSFNITASHLERKIQVSMHAEFNTFNQLAIPTKKGFVKNGCAESYATSIHVQAYEFGEKVEDMTFYGAGLEFGASYQCN